MADDCEIPRCHNEADVIYLRHGICTSCWNRFTANDAAPDALRMVLGIEAPHEPTMEDTMSKKKTEAAPEVKPEETGANEPAAKADPGVKAGKGKKAEPKAQKKPEPKAKEELCVFALRMSPQERDALHEAAGPAKASRFARVVLAAAARGDEAAVRAAIREAWEPRS